MYAITGASGQLGRLVIDALLETVPADRIVAAVRNPAKARDLEARGVVVREADYKRPETLASAFVGVDKLLLISSTEVAGRLPLHRAVIDAARRAEVSLLAYTRLAHEGGFHLDGYAAVRRWIGETEKSLGLPPVR